MPQRNDKNRTKILVALDGSPDWIRTVSYLGRMAGSARGLDILLYHVLELHRSGEDAPPGDSRARIPVKTLDATNESWLAERRSDIEREILKPAREMLEAAGPNGDMRVGTAVSAVTTSVAEDLIDKVRRDGYDTLVLERRRRSSSTGPKLGQVAAAVVGELGDCAVWILG